MMISDLERTILFLFIQLSIWDVAAELCSIQSHTLEQIRKGASHYKYCSFGCCKETTLQDPCCSVVGPVLVFIISGIAVFGLASVCLCFCKRRNNRERLVTDLQRRSSAHSGLKSDSISLYDNHVQNHRHAHTPLKKFEEHD